MSFESELTLLLNPLFGGNVFWDVTPDGFKGAPFVIIQQIGGRGYWYYDFSMPSHKHARLQLNIYHKGRQEVADLARLVEKTICESEMIAELYGAFSSDYEHALKLNGTRQSFGIWYPSS